HFRIGRGVIGQRRKIGDLFVRIAIGFDRLDDRTESGEFPRQLDVSVGAQAARKLAFQQRVASEQGVHFLLRQYDQSCNPSAAAKFSSLWRIEMLPTGCSRLGKSMASPLRQSSSSSSAFTGPTAEGE